MKYPLLFLTIFSLSSTQGNAQEQNKIFSFVPENINVGTFHPQSFFDDARLIPLNLNHFSYQNKSFVISTLRIFEGIKYRSILDQFSSIPVFDSRAYQPSSFSDYNNFVQKNYLTLNPQVLALW